MSRSTEPTTGPPRWVKMFGIAVAVLALVVITLLLTGGDQGHGPSRHAAGVPSAVDLPAVGRGAA